MSSILSILCHCSTGPLIHRERGTAREGHPAGPPPPRLWGRLQRHWWKPRKWLPQKHMHPLCRADQPLVAVGLTAVLRDHLHQHHQQRRLLWAPAGQPQHPRGERHHLLGTPKPKVSDGLSSPTSPSTSDSLGSLESADPLHQWLNSLLLS